MSKSAYYPDEENTLLLVSLLKAHGITHVVASPGTTNSAFVASIQRDSYFTVFSSVDERSAAYLACGLCTELGVPVVITCTGATASRNYLPGITEAFYRKLPILAVTGSQARSKVGHLTAQMVDRSVQPADSYVMSVNLTNIKDPDDKFEVEINANKAILELFRPSTGPIHVNLETNYSKSFTTEKLPLARKIDRYYASDAFPLLQAEKIAVFIGAHRSFSDSETTLIERFCETNNAVVFKDHTSRYYGKYAVNMALVASQKYFPKDAYKPDVLIHIGEVSGDYPTMGINMGAQGAEVWRVSPEHEIRDLFRKLRYVFEMRESEFFSSFVDEGSNPEMTYYALCTQLDQQARSQLPEVPLSNIWLASRLAYKIPQNSVIHFGILNSLRAWNFFPLPESVKSSSNVGGFGIDGGMSTLVGASIARPEKLHFLVIGDLAFFYDMNVLGNRHVGKNLRILLVNNGRGTEFRNYGHHTSHFGPEADDFIAAAGHFGNQSRALVKGYAEALGFQYQAIESKSEFDQSFPDSFFSAGDQSILVEVFTDTDEESKALEQMMNILVDKKALGKSSGKEHFRKLIGQKNINKLKGMIK